MNQELKELNALLSKKVSQFKTSNFKDEPYLKSEYKHLLDNEGFEVVYEKCESTIPKNPPHPLDGKMVFRLVKWMPIVKDTETYEEMVSFIENDFNPKNYR